MLNCSHYVSYLQQNVHMWYIKLFMKMILSGLNILSGKMLEVPNYPMLCVGVLKVLGIPGFESVPVWSSSYRFG